MIRKRISKGRTAAQARQNLTQKIPTSLILTKVYKSFERAIQGHSSSEKRS
jgi:hypothetical protein